MDTKGKQMHDAGEDERREAARAMGQARTPAKVAAAQATAAARRGVPLTEEHRAKLAEAQRVRREREKQAKGTGEAQKEQASDGKG